MPAVLDAATVLTALDAICHDAVPSKIRLRDSYWDSVVQLYDLYWRPKYFPAAKADYYRDKGFSPDTPTVTLSGTAVAGGVTEAQMVTGGETLIITLGDGLTWIATAGFDAVRQSIIDGLSGSVVGGTGFNEKVKALLDVDDVVRTSDVAVTITTDAAAQYAIAADETVTVTLPGAALVGAKGNVIPIAVPGGTFVITNSA